jgi:dihydrofolate synthase/folylpolyglutamate synthase
MTYAEAIDWWHSCIDFERRSPQPSELKLEQMRRLLQLLGDPQDLLHIVHVAGSKGKGSTAAFLASILRAAGYRIGLFTSPHLCRVEERIHVNDEAIPREDLAELLTTIRRTVEPELAPTFFEVGTAVGWLHFLRERVDIAVVEVGLGGRFDSTNVCTPLLSLITSISYDHVKILGDRLGQIAFEKAGILKPGRPAVSGASDDEAVSVILRVAAERGVPLEQLNRDFRFEYQPGFVDVQRPRVTVKTKRQLWPIFELGLLGSHQAANAAVVLAGVESLQDQGFSIPVDAVQIGLRDVKWPARLEVVGRRPWVVLDCAHNTASVQALIETIAESFPPCRRIAVFGASADKDVKQMLRQMAPHFDHFIFTQFQKNPRAVPATDLAEACPEIRSFDVCPSPLEAWSIARLRASTEHLIAITGSVFLAGEFRSILDLQPRRD